MYIATGGKDQCVKIWDYVDLKQPYMEYKCDSVINSLAFNQNYQWLATATDTGVKIWDIAYETHNLLIQFKIGSSDDEKAPEKEKSKAKCMSVCWSANGKRIYV